MVGVNGGGFSDRTWILWKLPPAPSPPPIPITYSVIKCEVQTEPSHPAPPPIDISNGALAACRHFTEAVAPGIIYRFQIHCLDQSGGTMGLGGINADVTWPQGCVVRDSQSKLRGPLARFPRRVTVQPRRCDYWPSTRSVRCRPPREWGKEMAWHFLRRVRTPIGSNVSFQGSPALTGLGSINLRAERPKAFYSPK